MISINFTGSVTLLSTISLMPYGAEMAPKPVNFVHVLEKELLNFSKMAP